RTVAAPAVCGLLYPADTFSGLCMVDRLRPEAPPRLAHAWRASRRRDMSTVTDSLVPSTLVLIVANFLLSTVTGIGLYQHCVVIPAWFREPPASFARINQSGKAEVRFWAPLQALPLLALVVSLLLHWHEPARRVLLVAACACYLVVAAVTAVYFAPRILAWGKIPPDGATSGELRAAGHRWVLWSWMRQGIL